jgi:integrase
MVAAGQAANQAAVNYLFENYQKNKAKNTLIKQAEDLYSFADFVDLVLEEKGISKEQLDRNRFFASPYAWKGVTHGLIMAFITWLLKGRYSVSTINGRLSTMRVYAGLAVQAEVIAGDEYNRIKLVKGYSPRAGKIIEAERKQKGIQRIGIRKSEPTPLSADQVAALKIQPDTPQGRRDALLMCLLLDHGLRVGEIFLLTRDNFDLEARTLNFYRPKVDLHQVHKLTKDTLRAARAYLDQDAPGSNCIWRVGNRSKAGTLGRQGMTVRGLNKRVNYLGKMIGLDLSPHDGRHAWATRASRAGTPIEDLRDAGGWNSLAMPARYIEKRKISNKRVQLD